MGHAVSIFDETILSGAPNEDTNIFEVQRVTARASYHPGGASEQIQRVYIKGEHRVESQQITSCGYGGASSRLLGYFTVTFDGDTSRPIRYDVHPGVLKGYLEADIPAMEEVTVEKVSYEGCDSQNNFQWLVYFDTLEGEVPEMEVEFVGLVTGISPDPDTFYYSATEFPGK